jgi:hypothetical protein
MRSRTVALMGSRWSQWAEHRRVAVELASTRRRFSVARRQASASRPRRSSLDWINKVVPTVTTLARMATAIAIQSPDDSTGAR